MNSYQLYQQILTKQSYLCVGLDSDIEKIPSFLLQHEDSVFEFNRRIIDATAPYTVAYKPNLAFYESRGVEGLISLKKTVEYCHSHYPDIFLIADAKRGDIGNTAEMYAKSIFEYFGFDAVTLSPYMGKDSITPFLNYPDKWVIVLALTSNPGAFDFQFMEEASTGKRLFEKVLENTSQWGTTDNTMFVVGATKAEYFQQVRQTAPHHFLLVPGVGAQGGSLEDISRYGMNAQVGLLVNSSRGIIFASQEEDFAEKAGLEAQKMQSEMQHWLDLVHK